MPNLIQRAVRRLRGLPKEQTDRGASTVESEPTAVEAGRPVSEQAFGTEAELVELVRARRQDAAAARSVAERDWVLSVAMYENRQWLAWDDALNRAISLMVEDDRDRYVTHNLVRPLVDKIIALATMTKPDATAAPQSESALDRAAADEARAVTAHLWRLHARPLQTLNLAWWAVVCGVGYLSDAWDARANAEVLVPGSGTPDAAPVSKRSVPVGEVCSEIVPPFEVYVDPRAARFEKARWIIHETAMEIAAIAEQFGVDVDPDAGAATGFFDSLLPDTGGFGAGFGLNSSAGNPTTRRVARVAKLYERPTPRYPKGRCIVVCGDRLIYAGEMPLADKHQYPIVRLAFAEAASHPYGLGLVPSIAPLQVELNRLLTKATNQIEANKDTLLRQKGDGAGADAYGDDVEEKRTYRTVFYRPGMAPPTWQQTPNTPMDVWRMIDLVWLHMQHIAGIHDVNMGSAGGGITAGVSIEMLQQGDRTQLGLFTQRIEQFAVERDTLDIALYAQYAAPYLRRLMGLDDTGNPQVAQFRAVAFRALTAGGSCKVIVTAGSATPKSAASMKNDVLQYFQMGLLDPMNPAADVAIALLPDAQSDKIMQARLGVRQQLEARQAQVSPPPLPRRAREGESKAGAGCVFSPFPALRAPLPPFRREGAVDIRYRVGNGNRLF